MNNILLSPPIAFVIVLGLSLCIVALGSKIACKRKDFEAGARKAYACGEDVKEHRVRFDYEQFFPFAFYFTILHVVALMVATIPTETVESFTIAVIYIIGAMAGLVVLFRR